MIDLVIVLAKNGGHIAATSERGKTYLLEDTEFTDNLYVTWCDKSVAASFGVHGTKSGLNILFSEDSPSEIRNAIQIVRDNATKTATYEYIEALVYSGID